MIETAPPSYQQNRAPWGYRDIAGTVFATIVAFAAIVVLFGIISRVFGIGDEDDSDTRVTLFLLVAQLALDLAAVGVAAGFSIAKYHVPPAAWGLVRPVRLNLKQIGLTLLGCYAALWAYGAVTAALGLQDLEPQSNIESRLFDNAVVVPFAVTFAVLLAPVLEEMFFRGFLFHGLWPRLGMWGAAFASGLAFGVIHVTGADRLGLVIPFTVMGMLFARLVAKTGSLWNSIATHFAFNLLGVLAYFATKVAS